MAAFSGSTEYERNKNKIQDPTMRTLPREPDRRGALAPFMKMAKAIRKQAQTAERVASATADAFVANQMRSLAHAFRSQAEILKKKEKKKKKKSRSG
ncbi:hypothetical protein [Bradyrhizobium sp. USDA 4452]